MRPSRFDFRAVVDRVSVRDQHSTMMHLLGIDHKQLTYTVINGSLVISARF
jgi:hypothetical protein